MALYVEDLNGDFVLDDDGNKIEFTVENLNFDVVTTDTVDFSVNSDGHAQTDKNLIVKAASADNHVVIKSQVGDIVRDSFLDLWVSEYLRMYANCVYQIDRADSQNVKMDSSRKVETIYDKSNEESDASQTDSSKRPTLCTKAEKHNGRYFLKFNGSQKMISQVNLNNDAVNVFVVYKLDSRSSAQSYWNNGLFGHDNMGYDKFVAYSASNLVVSGANNANKCVYIGPAASLQSFLKLGDYSTNDIGKLNVWHSLSVHWDNKSSPKTEKSKIYWNKIHIGDFTADNRVGNNTTVFGGLNPSTYKAPLNGNIAFFCVYLNDILDEKTILDHHQVLMERYNIV